MERPSGAFAGENSFQIFIDSITDYAIYMLDPDGIVVSWNQGAQRFKGYTAQEIIGQHFSCFYPADDQAADLPAQALHRAKTEGSYEDEGWRIRKDGVRFWANVVIDPVRDGSGVLVGYAKITRDLTERKLAQEAIQHSEQQFRLLVGSVTDYAIYMLSPNGHITNWNTGAQHIKGYIASEVLGSHFSRFYTEEDRASDEPTRALATALSAGRYEKEGWRLRKDGTRFWANVVIDPVRNDDGDVIGFAKITRDITERLESQLALERTQEALMQAQKMEAVGQLTGGIAHDFNNLLTVIVNSLDLLESRLVSTAEQRLLRSAQQAAERGARLTQQLLAFSRRQPLSPKHYNLNALIGHFETILRRACDEPIAVELRLQAPALPVLVDAANFEATLLNLIVNASHAMPLGGRLVVSTQQLDLDTEKTVGTLAAGPYIRVSVTDNGCGMDDDTRAHAFEPFFTTKEVGKGTGLGLSQVYGFLNQSGGDVTIDSATGEESGTTIHLYFPVAQNAVLKESLDHNVAKIEKILIVEDEPEVLEMAAEIFRTMGYDVLTAANGPDALNLLKRTDDIEVLFTDVVMPRGLNGVELARLTRTMRPEVDILLASGYPAPFISNEHGAIDEFIFISKPYRWSEVIKKIRQLKAKRVLDATASE